VPLVIMSTFKLLTRSPRKKKKYYTFLPDKNTIFVNRLILQIEKVKVKAEKHNIVLFLSREKSIYFSVSCTNNFPQGKNMHGT
jgi:hypothetical protein